MKEIAEIVGVSKQAVWAALCGKPNVSARTRERITRVARQIGYEPHGVPVVTVNVGFDDDVDAVCADNEGGMAAMIDHIASMGHEWIAYVNTDNPLTGRIHSSVRVRQNAYLKAMAERC